MYVYADSTLWKEQIYRKLGNKTECIEQKITETFRLLSSTASV